MSFQGWTKAERSALKSSIMQKKDQKANEAKEQQQGSPYEELYGRKDGDLAQGDGEEVNPRDSAGAFGSAASEPGDGSKEDEESNDDN